jgi:molybdate transport system substrate-binding protein
MTHGLLAVALVLAAASSSRPVLEALRPELEKAAGGAVELRYGETGALVAEIRKGAEIDLFLASHEGSVRRLAEDGRVDEASLSRCATGTLSLVAVKGAPFELPRRLDGATALAFVKLPVRRLAILSAKTAPEGVAAEEVLEASRILREMQEKLIRSATAEEAIEAVRTGTADVAILPSSLVPASGFASSPVDPTLHGPLKQTAAVVSASTRKDAALRVLDILSAPETRETWKRLGFSAP